MKAISLIQPWATLWALGIKTCETRSWPTQHRGEIYIHASKSDSEEGQALWSNPQIQHDLRISLNVQFPPAFSELPRGVIIGRINIVKCVLMTESVLSNKTDWLVSDFERICGDWSRGRFAFVGESPQLIDPPLPAKGQLGIWEYDPEQFNRERAEKEEQKRAQRQSAAIRRRLKKEQAEQAERRLNGSGNYFNSYMDVVPAPPWAIDLSDFQSYLDQAAERVQQKKEPIVLRPEQTIIFDPTKPIKRKLRLE